MRETKDNPNQINVELIVRSDCGFCDRINDELIQMNLHFPEMCIATKHISEIGNEKRPMGGITPSIWVNGELWFLGSFDNEIFQNRIQVLATKLAD